ncbi:hypothetical protein SNE40_003038 [Patella caerulea]|uniref:Uncharacterized protein n=1 Tax=Patella caerulea TaxID=87958 RepID=A0AAN8QEQ8_PATCE
MGFCGSDSDAFSVEKGVVHNECFVDVMNIIPHALLLLICIFVVTVWNHSIIGELNVKTWVHFQGHNVRWLLTLTLMLINIVEIGEGFVSDSYDPDTVNYHSFVPQCVAFTGTIISIVYYHNVEMWNSPRFLLILMVYWPGAMALKVLKLMSVYRNNMTLEDLRLWLCWMVIIGYALLFLVELNVLRAQRYALFKNPRRRKAPEDLENTRYIQSYANLLSKAVFWWVTDIMIEGYKRPIEIEDLGELPQSERSETQLKKLKDAFEQEKFKASQKPGAMPSITKSYLKAFWKMLLLAAVYRLIGDLLAFVGPVSVEYIVDYAYDIREIISNPNSTMKRVSPHVKVSEFIWNGYVLTVIMFLALVIQNTLLQNHHYLVIREGIRLRTAIQNMVYDKALKMSTLVLSGGKMTVGQIINHLAVDSLFLMLLFFFIHYLWAIPIQVILALGFLYYKLGISALIGGSVVILAAPIMYGLGLAMSKLQKRVMKQSDIRVKMVNELIHCIRGVKLLAWEKTFVNKIEDARKTEIGYLYPQSCVRGLMGFVGMATPAIGAMVTFLSYPYIENEPLSAGKALSALALFNLLSQPLQLLTVCSNAIANAKVSAKRLIPFLIATEVEAQEEPDKKSVAVETENEDIVLEDMSTDDTAHGLLGKKSLLNDDRYGSHSTVESRTPTHSRQNSGASIFEMFDNKRHSLGRNSSDHYLDVKHAPLARKSSAPSLGYGENNDNKMRRRHHSGVSTEDEDEGTEDIVLIEPRLVLEIADSNFSWNLESKTPYLSDINIKIRAGKLTAIVGPVGSGKSSLIAAMLGEMMKLSGHVEWARDSNIAYCAQSPWLLHATIRDNITFGQPYIWRKYRKVLHACSLNHDIESFPAGDLTEIGEKGITLSGGQKQRVSLARALYSEAEIVILDSPLSGLDAHVSRHVFDEAILNRLIRRKRTVILVTHHLQYLSYANQVIVMKEGRVQLQSRVSEVKKINLELYESWRKAIKEAKVSEIRHKLKESVEEDIERRQSTGTLSNDGKSQTLCPPAMSRQVSQMSVMTEATNENESGSDEDKGDSDKMVNGIKENEKGLLVKKEHKETGAVRASVYFSYLKACTITLCILSLVLSLLYHGILVGSNFWLSVWSSEGELHRIKTSKYSDTNNTNITHFDNGPYVKLYAALSMSSIGVALISTLVLHYACLFGARVLYNGMLQNVVSLPIRFFDTNPSGRVLNRFSGDVTNIDQKLAANIEGVLRTLLYTFSAIVVNSIATPYFLLAAIPLIFLYYCLQRFFRSSARELQRLDSVSKSPIFAHFSETLSGLQTIRAYKAQGEFQQCAMTSIDHNVMPFLFLHTTNRWLGIRLDYLGCLLVFVSSIASLTSGILGNTNPAFIGLSITYSLLMSGLLNWIVRTSAEVEMSMNAVERVLEYTEIPTEFKDEDKCKSMENNWPDKGCIEYKDVTLTYDTTIEPVVKNINLVIEASQKVGVCGRTGSGKSSLTLALFRALEIAKGQILIDGLDIRDVHLKDLRSRLSIISQDPVLFNGSVRFNLDPDKTLSEDKLWSALEIVQLKDVVSNLPQKIDSNVSESGDNFSAGQKKLLCLARAFLRDSRIIILDEATASIDLETEKKLQDILLDKAFEDKTIITIAHRISTIMCYDKILVMENGHIAEYDTPQKLLENPDSRFSHLVKEANK